jgi:hypothetical protein
MPAPTHAAICVLRVLPADITPDAGIPRRYSWVTKSSLVHQGYLAFRDRLGSQPSEVLRVEERVNVSERENQESTEISGEVRVPGTYSIRYDKTLKSVTTVLEVPSDFAFGIWLCAQKFIVCGRRPLAQSPSLSLAVDECFTIHRDV